MSDQAVSRVEVSIGDVHRSQLVVGDHNTIQTPQGTEVTVLQVGERPSPKLRPMPISRQPNAVEIIGRKKEMALIAASSAGGPVQFYAPDGAGKTSLLKFAATEASAPIEGVVFEPVRHRSLDEIQARIYTAFWQCDIPFIPDPAQIGDFLADREALLVLDDCGLDRSELETLLDSIPRCTVVLASEARTLWSQGTAHKLGELDPVAAVGMLERELGHSLAPDEQAAAEAVVARLGGNPQSLIETAALIEDGRGSLRELADDPAALERRFDPSALSDAQKRILATLSALDGAPLGTEHVSSLAGLPDAERPLRELERRGWVQAGSPRYRSVRRLPPDAAGSSREEITKALLGYLTAWSGEARPEDLAVEAEAIERTLELGAEGRRWRETLALSLAAERGLLVAGAWSSCRRVLQMGLWAASATENTSARAYLLHQLGSQALCLGNRAKAAEQLSEALEIRDGIGEEEGAALTRHNLKQLRGGGGANGGGGGGGGPPWSWMAIALAVLGIVAAGVVGGLALAGNEDTKVEDTDPPTTAVPPPEVEIDSPEEGARFIEGDAATASFRCVAAKNAEIASCEGAIDGTPVDAGDPLNLSPGEHALRVTAIDDEGRESVEEATYGVESPPPVDEEPPTITIVSPSEGGYAQGQVVPAEYTCEDGGSEIVTCSGPLEQGAPIDTKTLGAHTFTVTAVDSASNEATETVEYEVFDPGPG